MTLDFQALPKAEVHIHLEGCLDLDEVVALAQEAGVPLPRPRAELLHFSGLSDFLDFLDWTCSLYRTPDQVAAAAYAFSRRMSASGALYADVIVNPTHWPHWRRDLGGFIGALDAGFCAAELDGLPPVGLCVSLLRQQSAEEAIELVDLLAALRHPRVVALSVDGNEKFAGRTGPRFAEAFRRAGAAGLKRTVHAGESSGPEGVRDALDYLGADRIDHGVRAIEDDDLVARLADRQIPLGVCPTSNLTLGLYARLEEHPIERLRKAGVPVSVNTDDPELLEIDLPKEYARCAAAFDWSAETCRNVAATSIRACFAGDEAKTRMLAKVATW
ncbi:adenosine deaminase [Methylocapsa sp. S129]|uniref:adenosine deaminase n=1 Tax=Methylocapsa sp. S129 TaxID=1641869 RepID=UPI00131B7FBD|nr:adenosine deaminase [Methylocapsa sp. S129]